MAGERLLMRKLREILRLKWECRLSHREIARSAGVGTGTVSEYVKRVAAAGLSWPLPAELGDVELEARVFPAAPDADVEREPPDWQWVHQELRRKHVTLQLLWGEYAAAHPRSHYRYSRFCELYRRFATRLKPSMRQVHRAGEKAFVDFAGSKPRLVDPETGAVREVELFVGVLGASSLTYAEAVETQELELWIGAHIHMLETWGGSPEILVPDNLKSGVTKPCRLPSEHCSRRLRSGCRRCQRIGRGDARHDRYPRGAGRHHRSRGPAHRPRAVDRRDEPAQGLAGCNR